MLWDKTHTLCDPQIIVLSLGDICVCFMYGWKVPHDIGIIPNARVAFYNKNWALIMYVSSSLISYIMIKTKVDCQVLFLHNVSLRPFLAPLKVVLPSIRTAKGTFTRGIRRLPSSDVSFAQLDATCFRFVYHSLF